MKFSVHECVLQLDVFSGENVEDAFLETAKKIFQSIQDGRYINRGASIYFKVGNTFLL